MKPSSMYSNSNNDINGSIGDNFRSPSASRSLSPPIYKKSKKQFNSTSIIIPPPITLENDYEQAMTIYKKKNNLGNNHQENFIKSSPSSSSNLFNNNNNNCNHSNIQQETNFYENNRMDFKESKRNRNRSSSSPLAHFQPQIFKSVYSHDESKCHVCGDKSTGSHFGGLSCESCKAFFRRSVQNDRHVEYKCTYQNTCEMNINTRKICQACRYRNCLNIGMKPKWVLSDTERLQKYGSRRRKQPTATVIVSPTKPIEQPQKPQILPKVVNIKIEPNEPKIDDNSNDSMNSSDFENKSLSSTPPSPPMKQQTCCDVHHEQYNDEVELFFNDKNDETKKRLEEEFYKNGIDVIDASTFRIKEYDVILIDKIVFAYFYARQMHEMNMGNLNAQIATTIKTSPSQDSMQRASKITAANFIREPVKRLVTFAKLLPEFRNLQLHDQVQLLRSSAIEMIICSSINLFDSNTNTVKNVISRDRNIEAKDSQAVKLNLLRSIWPENVFIRTIAYLKSMVELKIDEATLVLYLPIILFSPDRHELTNRVRILDLQAKYSALLYKYLLKQQKCVTKADRIYRILLLKLVELRELHELHSAILLDVDMDKIDEYPQEIIKCVREENCRLKSSLNYINTSTSPSSSSSDSANRSVNSNFSSYNSSSSNSSNIESSPASFSMTPLTEFENI